MTRPKRITIHDQLIIGLDLLGYPRATDLQRRHSKYTVFYDVRQTGRHIYVGRAGALRGGVNVANSIPLDGIKAAALKAFIERNRP